MGKLIRLSLVITALMFFVTTASIAACSTSTLNGNWIFSTGEPVCSVRISYGSFHGTCSDRSDIKGTILQSGNCKITGKVNGLSKSIPFIGRSQTLDFFEVANEDGLWRAVAFRK